MRIRRMNDKWDVRFLDLARFIAQWSKDPSTKCGAVVVDGRRVVSVGFNGFARGVDDSPEHYANREFKLEQVIHCEENAILQAVEPLHGYSIYLTGMSCGRCAARVIQAGIVNVMVPVWEEDAFFYRGEDSRWGESFKRSTQQFQDSGVQVRIMPPTEYDASLLMGPEHPYMKQLAEEVPF
jgi:dCMP deaminase